MLLTLLDFMLRLAIDVFNVILTLVHKAQSSFLVGSATTMTAQSMNIGEQDKVSISIVVEKKPNAVHLQDEAGGGEESASVESWELIGAEPSIADRTCQRSTKMSSRELGCQCVHSRTTKRGSNNFVKQIRCKDCGEFCKRFECESQGVVRRVLHMSRQPYKIHESIDNFRVCLS